MTHTLQQDFEHFLSYSGLSSESEDVKAKLLKAYEANWAPLQGDAELPLPDGVEGMLAYERSSHCITYTHEDLLAVRHQALAIRALNK